MSRIKVLYDVFKTMKDKEDFNGDLKVETIMNEKKVFVLSNEFSTNKETGITKANISTEVDYKDNKFKHKSTTECNLKDHLHHRHGSHPGFHNHGNVKDKFSRITFALGVLNKIKLEEEGDKTLLYLDLKEVIKEIKEMHPELPDRECGEMKEHCHHHHAFVKELMEMESSNAALKVWINKSNEVEKIEVLADGHKNDKLEDQSKVSFSLLLKLA